MAENGENMFVLGCTDGQGKFDPPPDLADWMSVQQSGVLECG
jgi:hypothetical protein